MKTRSLNRQIFNLAIPSMLAGITIPLVGMADTAIAGRLGSATAIGGVAIGSTLFDLLYWNFGFLRIGTAGITAQAFGKGDQREIVRTGIQGLILALGFSILLILIQWPFARLVVWLSPSSAEVETLALEYFFTRIWAAPAVLALFVFRGWFIGVQNTLASMIMDVVINISNIGLSLLFALNMGMGIKGIALGTVAAQYIGLLCGTVLLFAFYRKMISNVPLVSVIKKGGWKLYFNLSGNLFIRSICMLLIYTGFTFLAAKYGDTLLAVATIMMKLLLLFAYFVDGFAYAGEALTGKFIGARDKPALMQSVKLLFLWSTLVGVVSTVFYFFGDQWLLRMMTSNPGVIQAAQPFLPWLYSMPLISCLTFMWDGIYIGATAGKPLRNIMILSAFVFYAIYLATESSLGIQSLWAGYAAHLVTRSAGQTWMARKYIFNAI
ncbi:MAG: MATE family efflux transporter [Bacteroidales bacterium]|jgi:MATE family multidrug resistance protein|nr:MATE family efflux transporter [Bacteroidales bacterium]HPJ82402.1 MATE family efflux transporter [Bacteroidales bacterium]